MLWQEENRRELLGGAVMFEATMAPLKRTMYLTYPEANEGIDLMVVVESNGLAFFFFFSWFINYYYCCCRLLFISLLCILNANILIIFI